MKKFILAIVLALAALGAKAADSLTMADFVYTNKLQVAGYIGESTLTDFPVLVRISTSLGDFQYSRMRSSKGGDLAFFAEDGTKLASEVDTWDTGGTSLVWVKLPSMTQGTKFYMCYRLTDALAALDTMVENPNPWGDYAGVWHLKETGVYTNIVDSTENGMDGKALANNGSGWSAGKIGRARKTADDREHAYGIVVDATNGVPQKVTADSLGTDFAASFWMQPIGAVGNFSYGFLIDRRKGEYNDPGGWGVRLHDGNSGKQQIQIYAATEKPNNSNYDGFLTAKSYPSLYSSSTWTKVDIHWKYETNDNSPAVDIYTNGVFVETVTLTDAPIQANANIGIGGATADTPGNTKTGKGRRLKGYMDEVRLRPGIPSADWVKADYDTVNDPGFVIEAPPEVFAVSWANGESETPGVSAVTHDSVIFGGTVLNAGEAASCYIEYKIWLPAESEPEGWTMLTNSLESSDSFAVEVSGLTKLTTYNYKLQAVNGVEEPIATNGTFTTEDSVSIAWSATSGTNGFSTISYDFAIATGEVVKLGDASYCDIQIKLWGPGETKPAEWTTVYENLGLNESFNAAITNLLPGTTYDYELSALGDDDERSDILSGRFTTEGEDGEVIGSPYTHYFYDGTNAYWVANDFERYLEFTVTGYTGTETLRDFPVLVEVRKKDTNGFTYDDFYHYDGKDIAFVDEKGHIIPHEIDTWNRSGMSLFWVKLPEMHNGTKFTMCYRSPLVDPLPDFGNTFEKYVGVWHMNETSDGVVNLKDSTTNDFETETHAASTAYSSGQIGWARRVAQQPGSSASYGRIVAFDHDDILRTGVGNVFTYSGWYKLAATPPKWAYLVSRKSEDADRGWGIQYQEDKTTELRVWSGSKAKNSFQIFTHKTNTKTDWHYWTFMFDGSVNPDGSTNRLFHAYLDGVAVTNNMVLAYDIANDETADYDNLCVVGQQNGTGAFNGYVDECRYAKGLRSADWIKAEYDSTLQQANWDKPAKRFVTKGTVCKGVDSLVPVVVWERGEGLPDTILDVSYAYVQFAGQVTYCGTGADRCRIEYQLWPDGELQPENWTILLNDVEVGTRFSIPVTGLKQDMLYNFRIRAVNHVGDQERQTREHAGQFRTNGNMELGDVDGELLRVGDKFVHRYRAGVYNFTTPDYVTNVEIIVVGGGGAGGYMVGGGGGGGGLYYSESFPVEINTAYRVHVGQGGNAATSLAARSENGENSYFALASDEAHPLIMVPGGGAGGSYTANADINVGADGASGGGGTYAAWGGAAISNEVGGVWLDYGHDGGRGNDQMTGGSIGKVAAGGGGGAKRIGLGATFDAWSTGGAGGVGVESDISGEKLFYGAGGGGGYIYRFVDTYTTNKTSGAVTVTSNFTRPGGGGSGIGGDAANVREGTLATSGVENTGAGGGGGSARGKGNGTQVDETDSTYWKGGDGGDGVVLISYEAHGRDPIAEEPRITMSRCNYISKETKAEISYRAYWAGIQAQTNDIYVIYSTVSEEDVAAQNGELVKIVSDTIGIGVDYFYPPEVGYTYWVRLVARKDANSFMYSDEIGTFYVPAVEVNGTDPRMPKEDDASKDYADVLYNLYYDDADAHLYCYWSENQADLEGDSAPTGSNVRFKDLGTNRSGEGKKFTLNPEDGIERNKTYYVRLATGNESGTKYFLSRQIVTLEMIDKPRVILNEGKWVNHTANVDFLLTTATMPPEDVSLYAVYSGLEDEDFKDQDPVTTDLFHKDGVTVVDLGPCTQYPDDIDTTTRFPMWSPVDTNYYARLALVTNNAPMCYSQRYQTFSAITAVPTNTLLVLVNANPKVGCYGDGDSPENLTYQLSYGGYTNGWGWTHWTNANSHLEGYLGCEATNVTAVAGQHEIVQGSLHLTNIGATEFHDEEVIDPETGEVMIDPSTGDPVLEPVPYYYSIVVAGAKYTLTNAQFTVQIEDAHMPYTGYAVDVGELSATTNGLRNLQPITYYCKIGTNNWENGISVYFTNIWTHIVQYRATAPNHDDTYGTFTITVDPAELSATISADNLNYLGVPQIPSVTTNVTGHVRPDLNPLTCEFRDEAGEWITNAVPSFTQPGTYKLFFRVSAPNHTSFTTNCMFEVVGWDYMVNMDGQEGFAVPLRVTAPSWLLETTGETAEHFADNTDNKRYKNLDRVCDNGLKLWQNYVIDRRNLDKHLVAAVRQSGSRVDNNAFVMYFPGVEALRNTGLRIHYRTERKLKGESEFTRLRDDDHPEMNVPLGPHDPTGLYKFSMVLTPTNELYTGEAVLASAATVGVVRVSSVLTNFVAAVPWRSMAIDTTNRQDVTISDVVNPNGLSTGDRLLYYNYDTGMFSEWSHTNATWDAIKTVSELGVSEAPAGTTRIASTNAFWLARNDPGSVGATNYVYLVGRYTGENYEFALNGTNEVTAVGATLVANPTMYDVALDDLNFVDGEGNAATPGANDYITVMNIAGVTTKYTYRNGHWGCMVTKKINPFKTQNVWTRGGSVPSGTGFWYYRTADSELKIRFEASR